MWAPMEMPKMANRSGSASPVFARASRMAGTSATVSVTRENRRGSISARVPAKRSSKSGSRRSPCPAASIPTARKPASARVTSSFRWTSLSALRPWKTRTVGRGSARFSSRTRRAGAGPRRLRSKRTAMAGILSKAHPIARGRTAPGTVSSSSRMAVLRMNEREWHIGVVGTFDLENYGDLLFPLIAEAELAARLGPVRLHPFSYHARTPPEWPYEVTSVAELAGGTVPLDGLLVGGGFLIRLDKTVAPGYGPPAPAIHHPTGYWLTPALIALQRGIPVAWNAPGMHCNEIPAWA